MCGIFGFFNPNKDKDNWYADQILPELLFASQLRGRDATGMFGIHKDAPEHVEWLKMVGPADCFLNWKSAHDRILKRAEKFRFVVGHVRAATVGGKDDEEAAHPHVTKNITLVHNGTLHHYRDKEKHVSDSAAIAKALEEFSDLRDAEQHFTGAWALVWHDKRDNSLNFARNHARPLGFAAAYDGNFWFASEPKMLEWVLDRKNKTIKKMLDLEARTWMKVHDDGKVEEIDLPFVSKPKDRGKKHTSTEYLKSREARRAFETINSGSKWIRRFEDCDVDYNKPYEAPRRVGPFVAVPVPKSSEEKDKGKILEKFLISSNYSLMKGMKVYFHPLQITSATGNPNKTIVSGPLCTITMEGDKYVEFFDGIHVRSRVADDLDDPEDTTRRYKLANSGCAMEAEITAIIQSNDGKLLTLWCKDATLEDWFDFKDWNADSKEAEKAFHTPLPSAASEVAAQEKKPHSTGSSSNSTVH